MDVFFKKVKKEEKEILKKLLLEYFKEIDTSKIIETSYGEKVNYPYLDSYWTDASRVALFVFFENEIAGFALVNAWVIDSEFNAQKSIAEFYIQPKYRRKGIGKIAAFQIFNEYKTKWEVKQSSNNKRATQFWRATIKAFSNNNFQEKILQEGDETVIVQLF